MQSNTFGCASIFFSLFLVFAAFTGANSVVSPNEIETENLNLPTPIPPPTIPAPIADLQAISFDELYTHPSGLFTVAQPTGWEASNPISDGNRTTITMINNEQLSVIEVAVERTESPITSMDQLDAHFDTDYLEASWINYSAWSETDRRVENERLVIDFDLTFDLQNYIARQVSWYGVDGRILSVRVVVPSNAVDELDYLLNSVADSLRLSD